jgi:hypothetical protein
MKLILLLITLISTQVSAKNFNCTSYGMVDIYVNGQTDKDFNITIIDLYFTEEVTTIDNFLVSKVQGKEIFKFTAHTQDWFININTVNGEGVIEMDYRGVMKQNEFVFCEIR